MNSCGRYELSRDLGVQRTALAAKRAEEFARGFVAGGTLFDELGFYYVGPVDGHNLDHLLPVLKTVRDFFTDDIYRLVVDSPRVFSYVVDFAQQFAPHLVNRVVKYTGKDPIFDAYGIESEITRALNRKVWLKSGGYLLLQSTEALTAIDVNTGKFTRGNHLGETILKTNLEAAQEIARLKQLGILEQPAT